MNIRLAWVFGIAAICITAFAALWYFFDTLSHLPDAKTEAVNNTNQIMSSLEKNPGSPPPTPFALWIDQQCWEFLQSAMRDNSGQFYTEATYYNLDDPNYNWRPVDEVTVSVFFPDGRKAEFFFYEGGLNGCQGQK